MTVALPGFAHPDPDATYRAFLAEADAHVARKGLDLTADPEAWRPTPNPPALSGPPIRALDLCAEEIATIVWRTGYAPNFGWIDIPVIDPGGAPRHRRGTTEVPGLYFFGLPYLSRLVSSLLYGVGDDAARLAEHIAGRRD